MAHSEASGAGGHRANRMPLVFARQSPELDRRGEARRSAAGDYSVEACRIFWRSNANPCPTPSAASRRTGRASFVSCAHLAQFPLKAILIEATYEDMKFTVRNIEGG